MRITIVQGAFFPVPTLRGGAVEKVWQALGREFATRGHTVTHISRRCDGLPEREDLDGVQHIRVPGFDQPRSTWRLKWRDLRYTLRAARVLPAADILVTNTFFFPLIKPNRAHGLLYVHVARFPKGQFRYYKHAVRLQCVSEVVANGVRTQCPALADRVRTLPNPLPDGAWEANPLADAARSPLVFFAGRIHPEKGLDILADAWRHPAVRKAMADWKLVLAGPWAVAQGGGGESYHIQLANKFAPVSNSVEWTGPLFGADTARLHALNRQARVFVYPSIADQGEALPLAPLEAMAGGATGIVSKLACFDDYLRDGENGLVFDHRAPDAGERLAQALVALAGDPTRRARLAAWVWQTAGHFRVEEVATRYLNDFESLLTKPAP